ncbi:MAG: SDR family NAD(P)-dependent oxidoreductase [Burkholderiales bacterium]
MKTILVTGATDGIGRETSRQLLDRGLHVLVHGRTRAKAVACAAELARDTGNAQATAVWGDLSSMRRVVELSGQVRQHAPALDVLVHCLAIAFTLLPLLMHGQAGAVDELPTDAGTPAGSQGTPATTDTAKPSSERPALTDRQIGLRSAGFIAATSLAMGTYGMKKWWKDGFTGSFRTTDEGWFQADTEYGGADKIGHAFSNYVGTRLLTSMYQSFLYDRELALKLGTLTTLGTFTAIEIIDGYSERWKFSKEDFIMNVAGAGLGYFMETNPQWDAKIDFRLLYRRSQAGSERSSFDPFTDYPGQTFVLAVKASGFQTLRQHGWLRYLEGVVGYNARGFATAQGVRIEEPTRSLYVGIALNLSEILNDTVFRNSKGSRTQRTANGVLEFVQVPRTAAALDYKF